jgi:hypothetical protein
MYSMGRYNACATRSGLDVVTSLELVGLDILNKVDRNNRNWLVSDLVGDLVG